MKEFREKAKELDNIIGKLYSWVLSELGVAKILDLTEEFYTKAEAYLNDAKAIFQESALRHAHLDETLQGHMDNLKEGIRAVKLRYEDQDLQNAHAHDLAYHLLLAQAEIVFAFFAFANDLMKYSMSRLGEKACPNCGMSMPEHSKFCGYCGKKLE